MRRVGVLLPGTIKHYTITTTMPPKSKKYCAMCSNYRDKNVDGYVISLHRFPANDKIRKVWLQRCKLVMRTFKFSDNSKLCSKHFVGRNGPSIIHTIPSIFGKKEFRTSVGVSFIIVSSFYHL